MSKKLLNTVDDEDMLASEIIEPDPVDIDDLTDDIWKELVELHNPLDDDPSFKPIKREEAKHKEAFYYWYGLSDREQTNRAVAEKFEVSAAIVGRWKKSFNWDGRKEYLRRDELKAIQEASLGNLKEEVGIVLASCKILLHKFIQKANSNDIEMGVNEFIAIAKFALDLREKIDPTSGNESDLATQLELTLKAAGDGAGNILVSVMNQAIQGNEPVIADTIIEAEEARALQNRIEMNEIGASDPVLMTDPFEDDDEDEFEEDADD